MKRHLDALRYIVRKQSPAAVFLFTLGVLTGAGLVFSFI